VRVLLLSRYGRLGASSRLRSLQYLPFLESKGWQVDVSPLFSDGYIEALYGGQPRWKQTVSGYWRRFKALLRVRQYDLLWIEKELFPFLPALAERLLAKVGVLYMVDYDDALFHRYDQHHILVIRLLLERKIDTVMENAALVVAGNEYLAERASQAGARQIEVIPTVVDLQRYKMLSVEHQPPLVVGWIGSPSTIRYLADIASVFSKLCDEFAVRFVAVGVDEKSVADLPIEAQPWSEETEVQTIQKFDIGIMPLPDSPWERGKCGYKLIQYMACGLPVVASPVGVNRDIVEEGVNGFLAEGLMEWEQALRKLLQDNSLRQRMGKRGRELVGKRYSLQIQSQRLEAFMRSLVG